MKDNKTVFVGCAICKAAWGAVHVMSYITADTFADAVEGFLEEIYTKYEVQPDSMLFERKV